MLLTLKLGGPCLAWCPDARFGEWRLPDGSHETVWVRRSPLADETRRELLQTRAERLVGRQGLGLATLLKVELTPSEVVWLLDPVPAVGLGRLVGAGLPPRAAAELIRTVALVLTGLGPDGLIHPGPEPDDLLVGEQGEVYLVARFDDRPTSTEPALVRRLARLASSLITTSPAALERVLAQALSEDPRDDQDLVELADQLEQIRTQLPGPGLAGFAQQVIPDLRRRLLPGPPTSPRFAEPMGETDHGTLSADDTEIHLPKSPPPLATLPGAPERTEVSELPTEQQGGPPPLALEHGIPISVGPPASAFARRRDRPRLPPEFRAEVTSAPARDAASTSHGPLLLVLLLAIAALLIVAALLLGYLLYS